MRTETVRRLPRLLATGVAAVLGSGVILGLVQANVQEWAKANNQDQWLVRFWGPAMASLGEAVQSPIFLMAAAAVAGGAWFLWADYFVRQWATWNGARSSSKLSLREVDRRLASMTLVFLFATGLILSVLYLLFGSEVRQVSGRPVALPDETETKGPIEWKWKNLVSTNHAVINGSDKLFVIQIFLEGKNVSGRDVHLQKAQIISSVSSERSDMNINTATGIASIADINPVPPDAFFQLSTDFGIQGGLEKRMTDEEFMKKWGVFRFVIQYDGGETYTKQIDSKIINEKLDIIRSQILRQKIPLRPQITRRDQSQPTPTPPNEPQSPHPTRYNPHDVRALLDALTEAHTLEEKTISPVIARIANWGGNWRGGLRNSPESLARILIELRDQLKAEVWSGIDDFVYKKHKDYQHEMEAALALEHVAAKGELTRTLQVTIEAVQRLPPRNSPIEMDDLVEPQFKELARQANIAYEWTVEIRKRISLMTDNLNKNGTAVYEKK